MEPLGSSFYKPLAVDVYSAEVVTGVVVAPVFAVGSIPQPSILETGNNHVVGGRRMVGKINPDAGPTGREIINYG